MKGSVGSTVMLYYCVISWNFFNASGESSGDELNLIDSDTFRASGFSYP